LNVGVLEGLDADLVVGRAEVTEGGGDAADFVGLRWRGSQREEGEEKNGREADHQKPPKVSFRCVARRAPVQGPRELGPE
jgi:hypothetical protein